MTVKLEDIAKKTGFSVPTVSRVLSKSNYPVNDETREIILEAAKALGYSPNIVARSLRTSRTNMVGIIVDDLLSPFTPPIVRGIQDFLFAKGYQSLIVNADWNPELENLAIRTLISQPVDAIIFVEYSHFAISEILEESKKPHVFVHRLFGTPINNSVVPDDFYGASLAVRHLISLGHTRIGHISGPLNWHNSKKRFAGYRAELEAHAIPFTKDYVQEGDWEYDSGYLATQKLMQLSNPPKAIFSANDLMALGCIHALQDDDLQVPGDVAVVGYDNRNFTKIVRPKISTIIMPVYEMGWSAAEILVSQMEDGKEEVDELKIKGRLVIRESSVNDRNQQENEDVRADTISRRILLNRQPEDPIFISKEDDY
jgi:LacI family transcriptional regulator, repressor for deo operon, udp, cdd, tsx, nupC, and nupG